MKRFLLLLLILISFQTKTAEKADLLDKEYEIVRYCWEEINGLSTLCTLNVSYFPDYLAFNTKYLIPGKKTLNILLHFEELPLETKCKALKEKIVKALQRFDIHLNVDEIDLIKKPESKKYSHDLKLKDDDQIGVVNTDGCIKYLRGYKFAAIGNWSIGAYSKEIKPK